MENKYTMHNRVMICKLKISQWTGEKIDRGVTLEIEEQKNAEGAGAFHKYLVNKDALAEVKKSANKIRSFYDRVTILLPSISDRMIPVKKYFGFIQELGVLKAEFEQKVQDFLSEYDACKEEAKRRLGNMYKDSDFPDNEDIRDKFGIQVSFMKIGSNADTVVLDKEDYEELSKEYCVSREQLEEKINQAIKETSEEMKKDFSASNILLYSKLSTVVYNMIERLRDEQNKFKDSLVSNIAEVCNDVKGLNVFRDEELNSLAEEISNRLTAVSPQTLRTSMPMRAKVCREAQNLYQRLREKIQGFNFSEEAA